jgi:hypothetical protein
LDLRHIELLCCGCLLSGTCNRTRTYTRTRNRTCTRTRNRTCTCTCTSVALPEFLGQVSKEVTQALLFLPPRLAVSLMLLLLPPPLCCCSSSSSFFFFFFAAALLLSRRRRCCCCDSRPDQIAVLAEQIIDADVDDTEEGR